MKDLLTFLLTAYISSLQAQTLLQPGTLMAGSPTRDFALSIEGETVTSSELLTVNNGSLWATEIYASLMVENQFIYSDSIRFAERIDTLGNYELRQHQYQYGFAREGMMIMAGLSHRTKGPFYPVNICAGDDWFHPLAGWNSNDFYGINWIFSPEGIEYNRFDPRYIGYATSKRQWDDEPRITGVFNRFDEEQISLDVYDLYPERNPPSNKLLNIPIETTFFISHVIEVDRMLLVSGFVVDPSAAFTKQPKVMLIDLELQTWQDFDLAYNSNNVEILSGLLGENNQVYLIVKESDAAGQLIESRLVRYDDGEVNIASFGQDFTPTSIAKQTNEGVLLGGNYDQFGLKTAALFEVEQYSGLKQMIGYVDLGNVETHFKEYEETALGEMILGSYDSLNGTKPGSFMTNINYGSLISVDETKSSTELVRLANDKLFFFDNDEHQYKVVDASGRIHMIGTTKTSVLDLSELDNGFYAISVWSDNKHQSLKTILINH